MLGYTGPRLIGTQLGHPFSHLFPTYFLFSKVLLPSRKRKKSHISLMSHQ